MVTLVVAEPPSPYSYNRPSSGLGHGGHSSFGSSGFGSSSGFGGSSFGGSSFGGSSFGDNEGANVDAQLLEQVRQILLREESQSSSASAPSSQYGAPSPQYGVPAAPVARVVGITLENTIPSIQVASFSQQSYAPAPQSGYSYQAPAAAPAPVYSAPAPAPVYSAPGNLESILL